MVRISDARMSGTAFGTIVLHVAPEAAQGGPLALVQTGDRIRLSVAERRIDWLIDEATAQARRAQWQAQQASREQGQAKRGYRHLYLHHVLQAPEGCDFDFLQDPSKS
jgi:dihydroxy-acid dehydratase